jgi:hypothetical protein
MSDELGNAFPAGPEHASVQGSRSRSGRPTGVAERPQSAALSLRLIAAPRMAHIARLTPGWDKKPHVASMQQLLTRARSAAEKAALAALIMWGRLATRKQRGINAFKSQRRARGMDLGKRCGAP